MSVDTPGTNSTEPESDAKAKLGKERWAEFQAWYRKYILASNEETCSETIVVFPFNGNGGIPWYRDATTKDSAGGFAAAPEGYLSWNMLSVLNGSPELAVPVGEVGYTSKISLVEEKIPAALEIQAAYGCDIMLLNLVRELAYNTDATKRVKTGRFLF